MIRRLMFMFTALVLMTAFSVNLHAAQTCKDATEKFVAAKQKAKSEFDDATKHYEKLASELASSPQLLAKLPTPVMKDLSVLEKQTENACNEDTARQQKLVIEVFETNKAAARATCETRGQDADRKFSDACVAYGIDPKPATTPKPLAGKPLNSD